MAVGMFILSQKKRKTLAVVFVILCILQIIIGCGMTGSSLYIIIAVAPILHAEKSEVSFVFVVTGIYGTHVIFHWIVGINISQKCLKQASRRSTSNLFILWTCMGTNTIIQLLILSYFAKKMNKYISRSLKQSITTGMNQYLQDISWKETIDKLQYNNECCGLTSYEDWHEVRWLTKYHVDIKTASIKELRTSNEVLTLPVTPWSCCKVDFPMQCLHDPIQQTQYNHIWVDEPNIVTDSINTKGCLDLVRKPIDWVIKLFVVSSYVLCILHITIFMVSRILYTSARNAILLGNPGGSAPGWILGRGDCGYSGGKSVIEIMEAHPELATDTENTENEADENVEKKPKSGAKCSNSLKFFKKKIPCKRKKVEAKDVDKNKVELTSEDEATPLLENIDERKTPEANSEVTPAEIINSKTDNNKSSDNKNIKKIKILETGKVEEEETESRAASEKTKTVQLNTNKDDKSSRSKGPSSEEGSSKNSVEEEIKRLQQ